MAYLGIWTRIQYLFIMTIWATFAIEEQQAASK